MSKYNNHKIDTPEGLFDSKREYARWKELQLMERSGKIQKLRRQVRYQLAGPVYAQGEIGPRGGRKNGPLLLRSVSYVADFVYIQDGKEIVEDSKGYQTKEYKIKRAWMYQKYGILIKET